MSLEGDAPDSFEVIREKHDMFLDGLIPGDDGGEAGISPPGPLAEGGPARMPTPAPSSSGPSSSSRRSTHVEAHRGLGIQPQFNLDSAESLLRSFRTGMLPHFPCIFLSDEASVASLARGSPFVLLTILAAASGTHMLQGHSLYDDEFRKVLGLKSVASGERSLELLQGLLIYCAWYPYHLRPRNRQALQYIRLVVDIVHDQELDQEPDDWNLIAGQTGFDEDALPRIRALLAAYYLVTAYVEKHFKTYKAFSETNARLLKAQKATK